MNLLPKDEKFFDYFNQQSQLLCQASQLLSTGLRGGYEGMCRIAKRMEALEHGGDEIAHQLFDRLRKTFITPFDPEDIQALASALDDVLDTVEDATFPDRGVQDRSDPASCGRARRHDRKLLQRLSDGSACAPGKEISDGRPVSRSIRLEGEADAVERTMLTDLFEAPMDPIESDQAEGTLRSA